jgi:GxxExxY protein
MSQIVNKKYKHSELTGAIIGCAMKVHSALGNGFQEVIYQRCMAIEMEKQNLQFARELEMKIYYEGIEVGTRRVDFLVGDCIMVELKALTRLEDVHLSQALNYLEAYKLETGLLINFGAKSFEFKRISNEHKISKEKISEIKLINGSDNYFMKKLKTIIVLLFICVSAFAQNNITGSFTGLANQQIKLIGFTGFDTYTIDSTKANEKGQFQLSYGTVDYGMAYLLSEDNKSFVVILSGDRGKGERLKLKGENLAIPESIEIVEGNENKLFEKYASEHPRREQTLSAWDYLTKIYKKDSLFAVHKIPKQAIETEKKRIKTEDSLFLAGLPQNSYVSYYLPLRKLVSSVSTIAQYRTEEIPATMQAFREIDYTDRRLYKSGLLKEVIERHFWLIENSGRSLDSVYLEMNKSIDILVVNLLADEQKLNEITEHLFKLLEKRSLFKASEYLALKLLNEQGCTINNDFATQLESYRAMKKGNTAPDIKFKNDIIASGYKTNEIPQKLSDIKSNYTVVVFGASWCPQCPQELTQLAKHYSKWKKQGVEVVFVSLDEDKSIFKSFVSVFPFISICDYQKWESPVAKDYHIFATPTIYLLNSKREILLRPNSVSQLDSWIDWYLMQGNK